MWALELDSVSVRSTIIYYVGYVVPLIVGWEYFPKRRGMVSGIIVGGFGFGSFLFGFVATYLVNPENLKPDLEVEGGFIFSQE